MSGERKNVINWDAYYMGIALFGTLRSKDPRTQVGACIVDDNHRILSVGYNGTVFGMNDVDMPWHSNGEKTNDVMNIKNTFVVHAEANALDNFYGDRFRLNGATIYVTLFPCTECTKRIINAGIKRVVYLKMYKKKDLVMSSNYMFKMANVQVEEFSDINAIKKLKNQILNEYIIKLDEFLESKEPQQIKIKK